MASVCALALSTALFGASCAAVRGSTLERATVTVLVAAPFDVELDPKGECRAELEGVGCILTDGVFEIRGRVLDALGSDIAGWIDFRLRAHTRPRFLDDPSVLWFLHADEQGVVRSLHAYRVRRATDGRWAACDDALIGLADKAGGNPPRVAFPPGTTFARRSPRDPDNFYGYESPHYRVVGDAAICERGVAIDDLIPLVEAEIYEPVP